MPNVLKTETRRLQAGTPKTLAGLEGNHEYKNYRTLGRIKNESGTFASQHTRKNLQGWKATTSTKNLEPWGEFNEPDAVSNS